jgi:hypothetical protein
MPRVGSIVYFRCSSTEYRPAIVTMRTESDRLDLIVFVHPDDGFELGVASALFSPDELDVCSASRRSVARGEAIGEWADPN